MDSCAMKKHCFRSDFEYTFQFRKIDDHFEQLWQMKSSVRECLKDWLNASDIPPKAADTCANACSELIENCIKYTQADTRAGVCIHVNQHNNDITVETCNMTEKTHRDVLAAAIADIAAAADIKQLFIANLMNPMHGESRLGLLKIILETKGKLELVEEDDDAIVHVKLSMQAK